MDPRAAYAHTPGRTPPPRALNRVWQASWAAMNAKATPPADGAEFWLGFIAGLRSEQWGANLQ